MSTFVVRFVGDPAGGLRGRVRHVGSGEEIVFSGTRELLAFFEGMNALMGLSESSPETQGIAAELPETDLAEDDTSHARQNPAAGPSLGPPRKRTSGSPSIDRDRGGDVEANEGKT